MAIISSLWDHDRVWIGWGVLVCSCYVGMTPLHLGAWAGKEGSLKLLLENRALANLPAFSGDTALHLAAQHGYSGCVSDSWT